MHDETQLSHDEALTEARDLPAGDFSAWLRQTRSTLSQGEGVAVPCGECTACCTSSYFVHIRPTEAQTITRINKKLLFVAPGLPKGNVVLGYDEHGRCPMLKDNRCSIYTQRPLTCRAYDCRVFAAAGIAAGDADKALINQRVQRWRFSYPTQRDRDEHAAVRSAALFLQEHAACFPAGALPRNPAQLAMLAITVYDVFLTYNDERGETGRVMSDATIATAIMAAEAAFAAQRDHA